MLDRIKVLMESKGLSASQFADGMDVPRAVLSHILSGRNKTSLDVVLKIASTYRDVSLEWLLLGSGDMLTDLVVTSTHEPSKINDVFLQEQQPEVQPVQPVEEEKVQKDKPEKLPFLTSSAHMKTVKQVMLLYTDGTFEAYKPG